MRLFLALGFIAGIRMNMKIFTVAEMVAVEKAADAAAHDDDPRGITYEQMMENAGKATAQAIMGWMLVKGKRVLVLVGPGNNGGDGLVCGRYLAEAGADIALVARDGHLIGLLALADTIKPGAADAISALRAQDLTTVLLTGDSPAAGARIAAELGIERVHAGVAPAQKADVVRELQAAGEKVAMVGDGINDAVALATADLGLALVSGTDIALKAADIILVRDDLHVIPDAIAISRKTLRTIRTNLGWAFGYNIAAIPIAAAGLLNPLIAAAAMSLSSVLVVYNSLRIQRVRSTETGSVR